MRHEAVIKEHNILPENSKGFLADNPDVLDMWSTGDSIAPSEWPYLMLCRNLDDGSLTWHMLCNQYNIPGLIERGLKEQIDEHISTERNKSLKGIELLCRFRNQHIFLTEPDLSNFS